jgi:hypothetical protein
MDKSIRQIRERLLDQDFCEWCYWPVTALLYICLAVFLVCTYQIAWAFTADRHITLSESYEVCERPPGTRCHWQYDAISPSKDREVFDSYWFEFEPGVLHYDLKIDKAKYSFTYILDGYEETWPYLPAMTLFWIVSSSGLVLWFLLNGPRHLGRAMRGGED